MKKLLFITALLTAGLTNQVNASSNAQQLYQNFQNSLIAFITAAQKVDNYKYGVYKKDLSINGWPWVFENANAGTGIVDFSRLISLLTTLSGYNLTISLDIFKELINNFPISIDQYRYPFPSDVVVYYKYRFSENAGKHTYYTYYGYFIKNNSFITILQKPILNLLDAAIALNIPTVKYLEGILKGLATTGSNMALADYLKIISAPISRIKTLPKLLHYFNLPLPS